MPPLERAAIAAEQLAERLAGFILGATDSASGEVPDLSFDLAQGWSGLALGCSALYRCSGSDAWGRMAHLCLSRAVDDVTRSGCRRLGLFDGLSGVAWVAFSLSDGERHYQNLLASIESSLSAQLTGLIAEFECGFPGCADFRYDLISGLSGVARYAIERRERITDKVVLARILNFLVRLSGESSGLPNWYTPSAWQRSNAMRSPEDTGLLNLGLAHGIAGVLAVLSIARAREILVDGIDEAIETTAGWLVDAVTPDAWGVNWPAGLPVDHSGRVLRNAPVARSAWCYGPPGIANALRLASLATGSQAWADLAATAMRNTLRRPAGERRTDSPTFCHGVAGLLALFSLFQRETGDAVFESGTVRLLDELLDMYEPDAPFGFRAVEPGGLRSDKIGLLDGAVGVLVALLAILSPAPSHWEPVFLLR
jgi:lantibiotic modifying enzyme